MPWWGWIIVGAILLGSELMLIDAQFYLVFLGLAAVAVGLVGLAGYVAPAWAQWLCFGILSLIFMSTFRSRLYKKLKGNLPDYSDAVDGKTIVLAEGLAVDARTRIEFNGTTWQVHNTGQDAIAPGGKALIERTEGLTLLVRCAH